MMQQIDRTQDHAPRESVKEFVEAGKVIPLKLSPLFQGGT